MEEAVALLASLAELYPEIEPAVAALIAGIEGDTLTPAQVEAIVAGRLVLDAEVAKKAAEVTGAPV
jgi:hypothetical protein